MIGYHGSPAREPLTLAEEEDLNRAAVVDVATRGPGIQVVPLDDDRTVYVVGVPRRVLGEVRNSHPATGATTDWTAQPSSGGVTTGPFPTAPQAAASLWRRASTVMQVAGIRPRADIAFAIDPRIPVEPGKVDLRSQRQTVKAGGAATRTVRRDATGTVGTAAHDPVPAAGRAAITARLRKLLRKLLPAAVTWLALTLIAGAAVAAAKARSTPS